MFSYHVTKIDIPRVPISVVDLGIAIKGSVCYNNSYVSGEPTKEFSRMLSIRRRTDKGVLSGCCVSEGGPTKESS